MSLEQELKKLLIRDLKLEDVEPEDIENDAPLFGEGLGLDSLDAVELVVVLQKNYGIEIRDMEQGRDAFASISALARFVRDNQNQP